jgi:arginyl-tRNA synthetase
MPHHVHDLRVGRFAILDQIQAQKEIFGRSQANAAKKIQVEFVSANPTSSLHEIT